MSLLFRNDLKLKEHIDKIMQNAKNNFWPIKGAVTLAKFSVALQSNHDIH